MSLARQPFFVQPYPAPPVAWTALTQQQRDAWVDYARSVKIGWLDYQDIIRQSDDCYNFVVTSDMIANGGSSSMILPPGLETPESRIASLRNSAASIGDIVSVPPATAPLAETQFAVWATAPAATPAAIDPKANLFIGVIDVPAGAEPNQFFTDLGASYVAAFGTLAGNLGDWIVLWVFTLNAGKLSFNGGYQSQIRTLVQYGCEYYWPLNEASGLRRSIARPNAAAPIAAVTQTAGPIDFALSTPSSPGPNGVLARVQIWTPASGSWTASIWFRKVGTANALQFFQLVDTPTLAQIYIDWAVEVLLNRFTVTLWNGAGFDVYTDGGAGPIADNTWYMSTIVHDASVPSVELYRDGASVLLQFPRTGLLPSDWTATAGSPGANLPVTATDLAELSIWSRALSATEITALYSAGAGNRYPYT